MSWSKNIVTQKMYLKDYANTALMVHTIWDVYVKSLYPLHN